MDHSQGNCQLTRLPVNLRLGLNIFFVIAIIWFLLEYDAVVNLSDKATLCGLARLGPNHIAEWHLRQYWSWRLLLGYLVDAVIKAVGC